MLDLKECNRSCSAFQAKGIVTGLPSPSSLRPTAPSFLPRQVPSVARFSGNLTVVHINSQSLSKHYEEIFCIANFQYLHVILLSETWLKASLPSKHYDLPNYNLFRHDRIGKIGGGVAMYVRDDIDSKVILKSSEPSGIEFMFMELTVAHKKCVVGVVYWPPKVGNIFELVEPLAFLSSRYEHIVIMGDFNINLFNINDNVVISFRDTLQSFDLNLLELNATHHLENTNTWIDHIIVSDTQNVLKHGQKPVPSISKHDLLYLEYSFKCLKYTPKIIQYRDYKNTDYNELIADAYNSPWENVYQQNNINDKVLVLNGIITQLFDLHAPVISARTKRPPAPWITNAIRSLMKQRDNAFRTFKRRKLPSDKEFYKKMRNIVNQQIRNSKIRYFHNLFKTQSDSKHTWKHLKEIGFGKNKETLLVDISLSDFNTYFGNMTSEINSFAKETNLHNLGLKKLDTTKDKLYFKCVDANEVGKIIKSLKSNSTGTDNINAKQLKLILNAILPVVTHVLNFSLTTATFPTEWKHAYIHPIPKTTSPSELKDYRPISILPTLSKVLEKVVRKQLHDFLINCNLLNPLQSGFLDKRSTDTALLKITEDLRKSLDNGQISILTLLDYSKAFDSVDHDILIAKCKNLYFSEHCLKWLKDYLSVRQQCVKINDDVSEATVISRGVPQGSVLGPLLFLIYVNEIPEIMKYCSHHMYADDLQLYTTGPIEQINKLVSEVNHDLSRIGTWSSLNGLCLNPQKSQSILIRSDFHNKTLNNANLPHVMLDNCPVKWCKEVRNLGLIFNTTLHWNSHITHISRKIFSIFHFLKKLRKFLPTTTKRLLINSLVYPHLDYCDVVYNDLKKKEICKLQIIQNTCIRYIFDLKKYDHVSFYYKSNNILRLHQKRLFHSLALLYKIIFFRTPSYLADNINFLSSRRLREKLLLDIPKHKKSFLNNSFCIRTARAWNTLPLSIRRCKTLSSFKSKLTVFLLKQQ